MSPISNRTFQWFRHVSTNKCPSDNGRAQIFPALDLSCVWPDCLTLSAVTVVWLQAPSFALVIGCDWGGLLQRLRYLWVAVVVVVKFEIVVVVVVVVMAVLLLLAAYGNCIILLLVLLLLLLFTLVVAVTHKKGDWCPRNPKVCNNTCINPDKPKRLKSINMIFAMILFLLADSPYIVANAWEPILFTRDHIQKEKNAWGWEISLRLGLVTSVQEKNYPNS